MSYPAAHAVNITRLAEQLIASHLPEVWEFGFDRAKRRAGQCNYREKKITVSKYYALHHSEEEIEQVLLHEIAHALAGHAAGHGPEWKRIAREIGYTGSRLTSSSVAQHYAPWVGQCSAGHTHYRFNTPKQVHSCGVCSRRFSSQHRIHWRKRAH